MKKKFIAPSWDDIERLSYKIAEQIIDKGVEVDTVIAILRGGWIPARIIADLLGIERIGVLGIKFYKSIETRKEQPIIIYPLILDITNKNVLLVDDVADTGKSLSIAMEMTRLYGPRNIYTATLYVKPTTILTPDFYAEITDAWIIFPWEKAELAREYSNGKIDESLLIEVSKQTNISLEQIKRIASLVSRRSKQNSQLHQ